MKFIKPFFLGMIAAGGALVFELLFSSFFPETNLSVAALSSEIIFILIILAAIEEFFKLLIIYKALFIQKNSDREFLYSSLFLGLGFAATEIAISNYSGLFGSANFYSGILGIIFIHTLSAGIIGWLLLKLGAKIFSSSIIILSIVTALHFAYNTAIIAGLPR